MAKTRNKYVLLDSCGTAMMASESIVVAVANLTKEMSPTACQELVGCTAGCLEKTKGKSLNDQDCKGLDSCISVCRTKASKEPLEFRAARKYKAPVKVSKACQVKAQRASNGRDTILRIQEKVQPTA